MPCSALMLPPSSCTRSCTIRLTSRLRGQESRVLAGCRFRLVVVQIAVADVPEGDDANLRKASFERPVGALDKLRNARDRQRNIVLDAQALDLLRLADILAQRPQTPAPARRSAPAARR
jgi:hypothetical protein